MSVVTKIIDIIASRVGYVRVDTLIKYKEAYTLDDMDPNTLVPFGLIQVVSLQKYEVPIVAETGKTINWQSDEIAPGLTYVDALGNIFPFCEVWLLDGEGGFVNPGTKPYIIEDGNGIITVTFDWGYEANGKIVLI